MTKLVEKVTKINSTSKFHWEFMSPALFLFKLLKMSKLTRGPLENRQKLKLWEELC